MTEVSFGLKTNVSVKSMRNKKRTPLGKDWRTQSKRMMGEAKNYGFSLRLEVGREQEKSERS